MAVWDKDDELQGWAEYLRAKYKAAGNKSQQQQGNGHDGKAEPGSASPHVAWPEMDAEAFHGLAGQMAEAIDPITEADSVAVLAQILAAFGCAFGRKVYYRVGDTYHYPNLYEVICGTTSKGRKGTSYDLVESQLVRADESFADCVKSGLSSGEGIIHAVHDDIWVREKVNQGQSKKPTYEKVLKEESIADKRLLIVEQEFAAALSTMQRQGNTLSPVIRNAWDGRKLQTLTKHLGETATGAHVAIISHITTDELRARLDQVHLANGFANRFLFVLARRSKILPFPGRLSEAVAEAIAKTLCAVLTNKDLRGREVRFGPEAHDLWEAEYPILSAEKPGLFGFIVARAEAQVLRLAMVYALLDQTTQIEPVHLRAALAFWRYCEASARHIFGDATGDPVADDILNALRRAAPDPLSRRNISLHLGGNRTSERIGQALALLLKHGKARPLPTNAKQNGRGRPPEEWVAC
jgi:hypothetical protein